MRQIFKKYFFLLASLFILVHVLVPHHHHSDNVFVETLDNRQHQHHEHHNGDTALDEILVSSAIVNQDVKSQFVAVGISGELIAHRACCYDQFNLPAQHCFTLNSSYQTFVYHVLGLRAPPYRV